MDCTEFRQMVTGDPSTADGEAHLDSCADCQGYLQDIQALDDTLVRAMAIDVPELKLPELPDLDTEKVVNLAERRRITAPVWLAAAATVTLAAIFGVRVYTTDIEQSSLADAIIAHMAHEPYSRQVTDVAVSDSALAKVVPASVANLSHDAGLITYAKNCPINGKSVPHLVIQGERGPVTILLMPDETVKEATPLIGENVNGILIPVGSGSIAIIGEDEQEDLNRIRDSYMNSVSWRT